MSEPSAGYCLGGLHSQLPRPGNSVPNRPVPPRSSHYPCRAAAQAVVKIMPDQPDQAADIEQLFF